MEQSILLGTSVSTVLLLLTHIALWPFRDDLHRVFSYIIGCGCLGIGIGVTAWQMHQTLVVIDPWLIAVVYGVHVGAGGAVIGGAWLSRALWVRLEQRRARSRKAGMLLEALKEGEYGSARIDRDSRD